MPLGDQLAKLRAKKEFSQQEVASRLGIARTTYAGYENGSRKPDPDTLSQLADFYEVDTDYLLERTKDSGMAFYGGGRDWTEEEIEMAEAVIEAHRARKKQKEEEKAKQHRK